jgi:hypothetical protein
MWLYEQTSDILMLLPQCMTQAVLIVSSKGCLNQQASSAAKCGASTLFPRKMPNYLPLSFEVSMHSWAFAIAISPA